MDFRSRETKSAKPAPDTAPRPAPGSKGPAVYEVRIAPRLIDPEAAKVVRRLNRYGHQAYLVGGSVRDLLLGRQPKDFDVGTSARPGQVRKLFRNCRLIGRRFRLAHILFAGGKIIEVATFRREAGGNGGAGPGGEPGEAAGTDAKGEQSAADEDLLIRSDNVFGGPQEDAVRRDFTINALFYDIERRRVIDYVDGLPDLRRGVIRTIGKADVRFREDPVRILRAIRFSARLDMGIEPEVYEAMVNQCPQLYRSAGPRILEEVLRLLRSGAAQRCIYLAHEVGALNLLFPQLVPSLQGRPAAPHRLWGRLAAIDRAYLEQRLPGDAVLLAALLHEPLRENAERNPDRSLAQKNLFEALTARFSLSRKIRDRIQRIFIAQDRLRDRPPRSLRQRDYYLDALSLLDLHCRAAGKELPGWAAAELARAANR
jgi:poly(A) polymerase